jgi:hypothetical protein
MPNQPNQPIKPAGVAIPSAEQAQPNAGRSYHGEEQQREPESLDRKCVAACSIMPTSNPTATYAMRTNCSLKPRTAAR